MTLKRVAAINDLSGIGKCSLTVAIPIMSSLCVEVCPIPTAILTNQTGFDSFYMFDYSDKIENYLNEWKKINIGFDAIYSGFFASANEIEVVKLLIDNLKNSNTVFLCDPVMGDNGKVYPTYTDEMCKKLTELAFSANIVTPNITEACILADVKYDDVVSKLNSNEYEEFIFTIAEKIASKGPQTIVITGVEKTLDNQKFILSFAVDKINDKKIIIKNIAVNGSFSGTGDVTASIICGCLVNGIDIQKALTIACDFVEKSVHLTAKNDRNRNLGIMFEPYLHTLNDIIEKENV